MLENVEVQGMDYLMPRMERARVAQLATLQVFIKFGEPQADERLIVLGIA